jgi:hypothetical protein
VRAFLGHHGLLLLAEPRDAQLHRVAHLERLRRILPEPRRCRAVLAKIANPALFN